MGKGATMATTTIMNMNMNMRNMPMAKVMGMTTHMITQTIMPMGTLPRLPKSTFTTKTAGMTTTMAMLQHPSTSTAPARAIEQAVMPQAAPSRLLRLMWLASPALPVGGFSYSEVLESAVDAGQVTDAPSASRWLGTQMQLSLARSELPLVKAAWTAWAEGDATRVAALNEWVLCTRESRELRAQTEQMGRSMALWIQQRLGHDDLALVASTAALADDANEHAEHLAQVNQLLALRPAPTWPVAFALAAMQAGCHVEEALLGFGFSWAENMVQAALKAVPLGQAAGQRVLAALTAELPAVVSQAMAMPDEQRQSHAPMLAILSAQHEDQYSRLFRS